ADIDVAADCYTRYLDYHEIDRGRITSELATLWGAPAVADSRYLLLSPAAGDDCVLRFVESPVDSGYVPFSSYGWNAAEIMVQNVDAMADRLAGSPFEIIGEPQNLSFTDDIRAMQILGPGKELLYLTEFKKQIPGLDTPIARCAVDSVFIVILGGPDMSELQSYYEQQFGVPPAPVMDSRVKGMSAAFGNSPEHKYPIAALPLAGKNLIEVDEMPEQASARPAADGCLPAGIAIVSFASSTGVGRPIDIDAPPYRHSQGVSCATGPAGELIETVQ
ncbi:MAG: hypothetical protein ACN4GT_00675, partial [Gammaproteobacteria bacterium]